MFVDTLATDVNHHKKMLLFKRLISTIFILGIPCSQSAVVVVVGIIIIIVIVIVIIIIDY